MTQREERMMQLGDKLEQGILLARKRMLHEKALHGRNVVIGDGKGGIVSIPAKDIIAAHKEFQ